MPLPRAGLPSAVVAWWWCVDGVRAVSVPSRVCAVGCGVCGAGGDRTGLALGCALCGETRKRSVLWYVYLQLFTANGVRLRKQSY